ncbi:hypothetical protein [Hahella sp. NBU794]|uniref:hypothetical protein n=1 Tax=Hahella sp. NBU794 TaxID=3422590 RepID=UPI003D6F7985
MGANRKLRTLGVSLCWLATLCGAQAVAQEKKDHSDADCEPIYDAEKTSKFDFVGLSGAYSLEEYAGAEIGQIWVEPLPVFDESDPEENNFLYRLLNKIHILTRTDVVSGQLLFKSGDRLDVDQLRESERILRKNSYLIDARIVPFRQCNGKIDLLVVTRDIWTLEPGVKFSHSDGASKVGLELSDNNIFGTGNQVSVAYNKDDDRSSVDYMFGSNHLFGTRLKTQMQYGDTSDGETKLFSLERPFYALDSRWAAGGDLHEDSVVDKIKDEGEEVNAYRHESNLYNLYFGLSDGLRRDFANRWYVGITREEDNFSAVDATRSGTPQDRALTYPWVAYERVENLFATYRNLDFIETTEDVSLGKNIYLKLGYGGDFLGNDRTQWRFNGQYSDAYSFGEHHLFFVGAHMDGYWDTEDSALENTQVGADLSYVHLTDDQHRWFFGFKADLGDNLDQDKELTLDDEFGLRGYPGGFERGDRRFLASIERRFYSTTHVFNLFRLGNVAFIDMGRAWESGDSEAPPVLFDIGLGMRLISSKARTGNVIHLDFAIPINERNKVDAFQWTLKVYDSF